MSTFDSYKIKASDSIKSVGRDENQINLALEKNPDAESGLISGTVIDMEGNPIANATVKLCLSNSTPYDHKNSNPQGKFIFSNIPVGSYLISAAKDGYILSDSISLSVIKKKTTNVTITISPDPKADKSIIYGKVISSVNNSPIEEAHVQLYQKKEGAEDVFIGISSTNVQGQYLFVDLDNGEYYVKVSKNGYLAEESISVDITDPEYDTLDISLNSNPDANKGVICGIITDADTKQPVPDAEVALYLISETGERLIQLTRTSVEGKYLFGDITPGEYLVKSTVQTEDTN